MGEDLALKYRPKTFSEMIGQKITAITLHQMAVEDQVPQGLLFSGPSGTGKTTAARVLARELNGGDQSFVVEMDAATHNGVDAMRTLIESLRYSTGGKHRIVILDEAHSLTREAFNALLKTLEEPRSGTIFVLVSTERERIPRTILSRLTEFEFRSVTPVAILDRLVHIAGEEKLTVTGELLSHISMTSDGNVRTALKTLDKAARAGISTLPHFHELVEEHDAAPALLSALLSNDPAAFYGELDQQLAQVGNPAHIASQIVRCLRDLSVLKAGGTLHLAGAALDSRKDLSLRIEADRILHAGKILWDLKTRVRLTDDPRGNLELALMLMAEVFSRGKTVPSIPASPKESPVVEKGPTTEEAPSRKLTLEELRSRR